MRLKKVPADASKQFFAEEFVLMDKAQARQMLKEKGYFNDEGFILSKFRAGQVFDLENEVLPFDDAVLMFHRDFKRFGCVFWLFLGDIKTHKIVGDIAFDCNEVYNFANVFRHLFLYDHKPFVEQFLYKPSNFVDMMLINKRKFEKCLPKYYKVGASDPTAIEVSQSKCDEMVKYMQLQTKEQENYFLHNIKKLKMYLYSGDANMAKVVSLNPLVIAAYSYDFESVVMLQFDDFFAKKYNLQVGDRLMASCMYPGREIFDRPLDMVISDDNESAWGDVSPYIALFFAEDEEFCKFKTNLMFEEKDWERLDKAIEMHQACLPGVVRKGFSRIV